VEHEAVDESHHLGLECIDGGVVRTQSGGSISLCLVLRVLHRETTDATTQARRPQKQRNEDYVIMAHAARKRRCRDNHDHDHDHEQHDHDNEKVKNQRRNQRRNPSG
jgi:hypothetical protein